MGFVHTRRHDDSSKREGPVSILTPGTGMPSLSKNSCCLRAEGKAKSPRNALDVMAAFCVVLGSL